MDFVDVAQLRTSVRSFSEEGIGRDALREICRIGGLAPSVNNFQPWRFVALTNKDKMSEMAAVVSQKIEALPEKSGELGEQIKKQVEYFSIFFEKAPAVIFVFVSPYESVLERGVALTHDEVNRMRAYPDMQSVGACIQNMLLAAVNMGLGACWMTSPLIAKQEIAEMLAVDTSFELAAMVVVGHPSREFSPKSKKEIDTILDFVS
jgi:nitroreductase